MFAAFAHRQPSVFSLGLLLSLRAQGAAKHLAVALSQTGFGPMLGSWTFSQALAIEASTAFATMQP